MLYVYEGKYTQAEPLLTSVRKVQQRVYGADHPDTLITMNNLALLYRAKRAYSQAEPLFQATIAGRRRVLGEEHPDTLNTIANLAMLYLAEGEFSKAELLLSNIVLVRRRISGPLDLDTTKSLAQMGNLRVQQQRYADAEPFLREAAANYDRSHSDIWPAYHNNSMLGAALVGQKKFREAEPLLLGGYEGMVKRQLTVPAESRSAAERSRHWIVRLYREWGKPEKVLEWRNKPLPESR